MHEINRHAIDFGLPAPIAFPRPVKRVEGNLPDEANDARFAPPNNSLQSAPDPSLFLTLFNIVTSAVGQSTRLTKFSPYSGRNFFS